MMQSFIEAQWTERRLNNEDSLSLTHNLTKLPNTCFGDDVGKRSAQARYICVCRRCACLSCESLCVSLCLDVAQRGVCMCTCVCIALRNMTCQPIASVPVPSLHRKVDLNLLA